MFIPGKIKSKLLDRFYCEVCLMWLQFICASIDGVLREIVLKVLYNEILLYRDLFIFSTKASTGSFRRTDNALKRWWSGTAMVTVKKLKIKFSYYTWIQHDILKLANCLLFRELFSRAESIRTLNGIPFDSIIYWRMTVLYIFYTYRNNNYYTLL